MKTIKTSAIGRNLKEAYDNLLKDEECYSDEVNRFEVLSARRISTEFQVADELAIESFDGQKKVEVWQFEVFGHQGHSETQH